MKEKLTLFWNACLAYFLEDGHPFRCIDPLSVSSFLREKLTFRDDGVFRAERMLPKEANPVKLRNFLSKEPETEEDPVSWCSVFSLLACSRSICTG